MKNKMLWIVVCAVLLLALVLALALWRPIGARNEPAAQDLTESAGDQTQGAEETQTGSDPEKTVGEQVSESTGAQILEDEGDIIITVPDDQESGGF